ncbi:MAG: alanine--tRNA ligase [Anaerolineaceae bacterium]|nr:alanine--tRNA ligase [Anaerolineaceae bacterium]
MDKKLTGAEIRQSYIDFFKIKKGHTYVPSSSLVPGGDQTLLFTNAGMVQFKDVFLGEDERPYVRAVNSQKVMRVAGKHNDLDEVGRDDTHHTFFEMLGNWSFGDYYKKEAIEWAWELITEVWGLEKDRIYASVFKDEKNEIPADGQAKEVWLKQPGFLASHLVECGRKENFWEMADTGPCGPCSEVHYDLGPSYCNKQNDPNHECEVNGDCNRIVEFWNLVFMQYNRLGPDELVSLPKTHVDTGMGFERIVSIIQGTYSNYRTDLFKGIFNAIQGLTGHSDEDLDENFTPYRVIADHARAASFLIADGVVPGNVGRNYICRMIIRRASRFGGKMGLNDPFLADVAKEVIQEYGGFYPELAKNQETILDNLTREEERFHKTLESGIGQLDIYIGELASKKKDTLDGVNAFELYATHGLPFEITRDILRESGYKVDEEGFKEAMEEHKLASGAGKAFGPLGGEDADFYRGLFEKLVGEGKLTRDGVDYNPYPVYSKKVELLALIKDGEIASEVSADDLVEFVVPETGFYIESGGQVADTGCLIEVGKNWEIEVREVRRPAAGLLIHKGIVKSGQPKDGDQATLSIDKQRRMDIMRNHTATHLLHAELQKVLGIHARQAGSLVSSDHLRFDFTHPEAMKEAEIREVEARVNQAILYNYSLNISVKTRDEAIAEGAMALFGEKYGQEVRTVAIGKEGSPFSYELCGGTHVPSTGLIGSFLITSESSAAAGIRRIEAVTGSKAYELIQKRKSQLQESANSLECSLDEVPTKTQSVLSQLSEAQKEADNFRQKLTLYEFEKSFSDLPEVLGVSVMALKLPDATVDVMREMADRFRDKIERGVIVLGAVQNGKPILVAAVTDNLLKSGLHAGNLVKQVAKMVGGGGGGRPSIAQAGGRDPEKLDEALEQVLKLVEDALNN